MLGETIGHYRISSKLGEGGMGAVYRATDTKLNREVAIKVLPDSFAADPDRLARFTREAQVLASLSHPNIATIFGVEDKALVMELVEGKELAGPLPLTEALHIAKQIAEGLEAAHDKGIIHRDLKPANIKVTPEGTVKILDFGLAKAADSPATATSADSPTLTLRATQAGIIMGTAGYMSPEQAAGKTVDKRADIWAFGVVLHELLTGKKLFDGETVSHTLASVLKDPIDFAIPQAPLPIQALLARCLDRNLKHRLKDIGEARIAIEDFLANPKPKAPETSATARRPTLWIALAGACALLAITFAALWLRPNSSVALASHFNVPTSAGAWILVSPDGKWLLKLEADMFYVRPLDSPTWRKVPGTEAATRSSACWSPDSASFAFVSSDRLRVASLDGAPPRDLMEVQNFLGASWRGTRTEGTLLVATDGKLKTIDLRSGVARDLPLSLAKGSPPSDPVFLPEGEGFVFLQDSGEGKRLYRSALNSSTVDPLFSTPYMVRFARHPATGQWHIFYLAGERELRTSRVLRTAPVDPRTGQLLSAPVKLLQGLSTFPSPRPGIRFSVGGRGVLSWAYISSSLPIWRLVWADRTGKMLAPISENRNYVSVALSPDDSKIAAQVDDPDSHVWVLDSKTGLGARISASPDLESQPLWAPDGKSVFFVSRSTNRGEIRRHFLDAATKPEILWQSEPQTDYSASALAGVSPDGRYVLIQPRAGLLSRLDLLAPSPRKLEPLTEGPGYAFLCSDGRSLIWGNSPEGLAIQAYPPNAEPAKRFARGSEFISHAFLSADGRSLYALLQGNLVAFPLSPDRSIGEPNVLRPWRTTTRVGAAGGVASRDGKRLLLLETAEEEILNPQVLTDWTTLLPK